MATLPATDSSTRDRADELHRDDLRPIDVADLRHMLATARGMLRDVQDRLEVDRARAEEWEIAARGGDEKALGPNEAARKRALILALGDDQDYQLALDAVRRNEREVERLTAEVEGRLDQRRERELAVRDKLADALLAIGGADHRTYQDQVAEAAGLRRVLAAAALAHDGLQVEPTAELTETEEAAVNLLEREVRRG